MTDERSQRRYLNEPIERKRSRYEDDDRWQSGAGYERQDEERGSIRRYGDEHEHTYGDQSRERSSYSGSSYDEDRGSRSTYGSGRMGERAPFRGGGMYGAAEYGGGQGGQSGSTGYQGTGYSGGGKGPFQRDDRDAWRPEPRDTWAGGSESGSRSFRSQQGQRSQPSADLDQDRDRSSYYRGSYSRSTQPYSYEGGSGTFVSESMTMHGPYTGKGPKGYKRSDQQICEEANQALERDGRIDASEIEVSCNEGVLSLTGKVESRRAKRDAEECVESIYGVKDVMNELKADKGFFASLFGSDSSSSSSASASSDRSDDKNATRSSSKTFPKNS